MITAVNVEQIYNDNKGSSSCCSKCKELYGLLSKHLTTEHLNQPPGNDKVLSNILLNLLSLLINPTEQNNTESVEKANETTTEKVLPEKTTSEVKHIDDTFSPEYSIASSSIPSILNSSELNPKIAFQPDSISSSFLPNNLTSPTSDFATLTQKTKQNSEKAKSMNSIDISSLMVGDQDSQYLTSSPVLVAPDGSLTPAGISLLLANQTKSVNSSGKSDLDVADILVNKMPIPSLNKDLDPNFLQLSTLYFQQLALNQQTQALSALNPNLTSDIQSQECTSSTKTKKLSEKISKQPIIVEKNFENISVVSSNASIVNILPASRQEGRILDQANRKVLDNLVNETPDSEDVSLQKLISRHKQISSLIDALNKKQNKNEKRKQSSQVTGVSTSKMSTFYNIDLPRSKSSDSFLPRKLNTKINDSKITSPTSAIPISLVMPAQRKTSKPVSTQAPLSGHLVIQKTPTEHIASAIQKIPVLLNVSNSSNISAIFDENIIPSTISTIQKNAPVSVANEPKTYQTLQNVVIGNINELNINNVNSNNIDLSNKANQAKHVFMVPISQCNDTGVDNLQTVNSADIHHSDDDMDGNDDDDNEEYGNAYSKEPKVLYKCDVCNVTFNVLSTLHSHMRTHMDEREEVCSFCKTVFTDPEEYYKHVASHRGEENVFKCEVCTKIFTSRGEFTKHMTKHTQRRPYLCSFCQKSFRDPGSLTKHERIHTGEQPYVCDICHRGFAEKSSLRKHARVHSGEKPYKCMQCDKSFSISGNLRRHMIIHTGQRPYKCNYCVKAFNNPSHLRRHIKNLHQKDKCDEKEMEMVA